MAKHVIFLGAGASYTSGYPLADGLKKILASRQTFENYLQVKCGIKDSTLKSNLAKWFSDLSKSVELFREGGFGTVDEFSLLAGKEFPQEVHELKQLVGLVLSLHNPEHIFYHYPGDTINGTTGFESSDYYPFIQRLFQESEKLRDDVTILTYNYDPYLEFLLNRAYFRRHQAIHNKPVIAPTELTSGFADRDAKAISERVGFCLLKLHGTSVLPPQLTGTGSDESGFLTYNEVFSHHDGWPSMQNAWSKKRNPSPAMLFPWEIINGESEFVTAQEFAALEDRASGSLYYQQTRRSMYDLFKAIWRRAQMEITHAEKISFVGLSMHKFLKSGLQYLFKDRIRRFQNSKREHGGRDLDFGLEVTLACPGAWSPGEKFFTPPRPNSPVAKLVAMLRDVNPEMANAHEKGKVHTSNLGKKSVGGVVCYDTFKDFIEAEL